MKRSEGNNAAETNVGIRKNRDKRGEEEHRQEKMKMNLGRQWRG
jgi:hypothetical protein